MPDSLLALVGLALAIRPLDVIACALALALVGLALAIRPLDGIACALALAVRPLADGPLAFLLLYLFPVLVLLKGANALAVGPLALALAVGLPHYYYN